MFAPPSAGLFFFTHDVVAHVEDYLDVLGGLVLAFGAGAVDRCQEQFLRLAPV